MKKIPAATYSCGTYRPTTIGAAAFHFRVRNGTGWDHCALATGLQGEEVFFSLHPACPGALGGFEGGFFNGLCVWLRRFPLVMRGRNQRKLTSAWLVVLLFKHALYEQDNGKLLFTNGSDVI